MATIDPELAKDDRLVPLITSKALYDNAIQPHEGRMLQEAVWLRDIGRWTQGDSFDDVKRATALFDWIVATFNSMRTRTRNPIGPGKRSCSGMALRNSGRGSLH